MNGTLSALSRNRAWRDWAELCRVSNMPTVWMNTLSALVLSSGGAAIDLFLLLALSTSGFYAAGMCWNDVFDRHLDALSKPHRPIPTGRVQVSTARWIGTATMSIALACLLVSPHPEAVVPGIALAGLIILYDALHKRHPATVVAMAGCRLGVFVVVACAATGSVPPAAWIGGGASFVHTLVVTIVARWENTRGSFGAPLVPALIAGMSITDGIVLSLLVAPTWLPVGVLAAVMTWSGQRRVRGD